MLNLSHQCLLFLVCISGIFAECKWNTLKGNPTKLIGSGGDKAYMPSNSLGGFHFAAMSASDYIEAGVCLSKDGILVVHENEWLSETTNVEELEEFSDRKRRYEFEGKSTKFNKTDWWVFDFTAEELKTLTLKQNTSSPHVPQYFNKDFNVITFEEYLDKVEGLCQDFDREFGILPELKSPEMFNAFLSNANGTEFEDKFLEVLKQRGYTEHQPPSERSRMNTGDLINHVMNIKPAGYKKPKYKLAAIQSLDQHTCKYLAKKTKIPIISLDKQTPSMYTPKGLDKIASYAKIFRPWKDIFFAGPKAYFDLNRIPYDQEEIDSMGGFLGPVNFVREAHKRGIELSGYPFRDSSEDNKLLCTRFRNANLGYCPKNQKDELFYIFTIGIDHACVENLFEAQMLRLSYHYAGSS
ncbi:hypothetical protein BB560_001478 [Smittium megazygosporum]|uniref:glycerophosphodiester phosphodiesterase n=1 Tax=Smittium megazygosporum TaxID=133381 RepID=A0A2T9ZHH2_9FUNG|nr:hypothetical protein BB560_001478 [Smittium megazygosporum]